MEMRRLRVRQVDNLLEGLHQCLDTPMPRMGWVQTIRTALGMTTRQLAQRLGKNQSTVTRLEKNEAEGRITLASLNELANAFNCRLVYALVPQGDGLEVMLRKRVEAVAREHVSRVSHTMALEDQSASAPFNESQLRDLVDEMMRRPPNNLWESASSSR